MSTPSHIGEWTEAHRQWWRRAQAARQRHQRLRLQRPSGDPDPIRPDPTRPTDPPPLMIPFPAQFFGP